MLAQWKHYCNLKECLMLTWNYGFDLLWNSIKTNDYLLKKV